MSKDLEGYFYVPATQSVLTNDTTYMQSWSSNARCKGHSGQMMSSKLRVIYRQNKKIKWELEKGNRIMGRKKRND